MGYIDSYLSSHTWICLQYLQILSPPSFLPSADCVCNILVGGLLVIEPGHPARNDPPYERKNVLPSCDGRFDNPCSI